MSRYASETTVSQEKSRAEIEATLKRYGATSFLFAMNPDNAIIGFILDGRQIRFVLPMPDRNDRAFTHHSQGRRIPSAAEKAWEQAGRQRWRALALIIKAKLEAVASGIVTLEDEFLAHTVLPDGSTVGEWAKPQLALAYERGTMPTTLQLEGPRP